LKDPKLHRGFKDKFLFIFNLSLVKISPIKKRFLMAAAVTPIAIDRANLFKAALRGANEGLQRFNLIVRFVSQIPTKEEVVNPDAFDERPDIALEMQCDGKWLPIDIVYLRQMPKEPEKLKSVEELTQNIYEKAVRYIIAAGKPHTLITSWGTIIQTGHLKKHTFEIDSQGYIRIDALRVVLKGSDIYVPLKASQLHSHTAIFPEELEDDVFNITDSFDKMRTDGQQGLFCVTKKADSIALEKISPGRREEAKEYGAGRYIPLVRTHEEVKQLFAETSNFFNV
jgi:hypothetical protein